MLVCVIYLILSALSAGFIYSDRRKREYDVEHDCDVLLAVLFGAVFPVSMPFYLVFSYVRYREKREEEKE